MASDIKSKTQRSKLAPRREPYWSRLEEGFFLGYRRHSEGTGTWVARLRVDGKQKYQALGSIDDYDSAQAAARSWRANIEQGVERVDVTVEMACEAYVAQRRVIKGSASAVDAEGRFRRLVYGKAIGRIPLGRLQTADVRTWLYAQLPQDEGAGEEDLRRAKDSANRNLANLKAALNAALKDRLVSTDAGWKTVTPFTGVGRRRGHMLTATERSELLKACPDDLSLLVTGLLLTAARPGELAKATVADFDAKVGSLILDGKTGRRVVPLSTAARDFFERQARGKLPKAPLFAASSGKAWSKDAWKKPIKTAAKAAGLPDGIVLYTLRHTAISEMMMGGIGSGIVALLAGTSTQMIDKHYGHLAHEQTRQKLDAIKFL